MTEKEKLIPPLPCPNCSANILEKGFYNYCSETTSLREDNFVIVEDGCLYLDHDERNHETIDHECALDAFCSSCDTELPWPLYEIRELDYKLMAEVPNVIAELLQREEA
jgi:hypothetical protein